MVGAAEDTTTATEERGYQRKWGDSEKVPVTGRRVAKRRAGLVDKGVRGTWGFARAQWSAQPRIPRPPPKTEAISGSGTARRREETTATRRKRAGKERTIGALQRRRDGAGGELTRQDGKRGGRLRGEAPPGHVAEEGDAEHVGDGMPGQAPRSPPLDCAAQRGIGGLHTLPQIAIDDVLMIVNGRRDITKIGGNHLQVTATVRPVRPQRVAEVSVRTRR